MTLAELQSQVAVGEDSRRQFKRDVTNGDSLAREMAAFANSEGGTIFLGVADDGSLPGLSPGGLDASSAFHLDDTKDFIWTTSKFSFSRRRRIMN